MVTTEQDDNPVTPRAVALRDGFRLCAAQEWTRPGAAASVLLASPAGAAAEGLHAFCRALCERKLDVLLFPPAGEGAVPSPAEDAARLDACVRGWRPRSRGRVCVMGSVFQALTAFNALLADGAVDAAILHAPVMPRRLPLHRRWHLARGRTAALAARLFGGVQVPAAWALPGPGSDGTVALRDLAAWCDAATSVPPGANVKPVLFLAGERDERVPPAHVLRLYQATGGDKRLEVVADAGHELLREDPVRTAEATARFIHDVVVARG
ncbi:MAG: alpha/beta hydrolase [Deltaproteobacteria bacterium]|nr:alpha/beta hydrolase [Deltaproteobacteria bacterium]